MGSKTVCVRAASPAGRSALRSASWPAGASASRPAGASSRAGFSIVEVMVAGAILAVGLGVLASVLTGASKNTYSQAGRDESTVSGWSINASVSSLPTATLQLMLQGQYPALGVGSESCTFRSSPQPCVRIYGAWPDGVAAPAGLSQKSNWLNAWAQGAAHLTQVSIELRLGLIQQQGGVEVFRNPASLVYPTDANGWAIDIWASHRLVIETTVRGTLPSGQVYQSVQEFVQ